MFKKFIVFSGLLALLSGCSIQQSIDSAQMDGDATLCVIENTSVRAGFLNTMEAVLSKNGVRYQIVNSNAIPEVCSWTATYNAKWSWDLALYMSYAEIKIFKDGVLAGKALYDSTGGGANMGKFIDAETKIKELVTSLLSLNVASIFTRRYS